RLGDQDGTIPAWGAWVDEWLMDAHEALTGEPAPPRESGGTFMDPEKAGTHGAQGGEEWLDEETVREALDHISSNCGYAKWRNIGFALSDHFDSATAKRLFDEWSRGTSKYDGRAEDLIDDIANRGSGGITIGTVVHHAQQAGWSPSGREPAALDAVADGDEEAPDHAPEEPPEQAETDGGAAADSGDASSHVRSLEQRIRAAIAAAENDQIKQKTARHRIAAAIAEAHHFVYPETEVRGWRSTLYVYNDDEGVYEPRGEAFIQQVIERYAGDYVTNQVTNEIVGKIERRSIERGDAFTPDPSRLVVGNGILDLRDGELDEWSPHEYHRTKIDVEWNPDAGEPDAIDEFFGEIVDGSDKQTLYRLIAHSLYKEYVGEKAAMLIGGGQNGKSVFLEFVERFIGDYNVSHRALQDFDDNRFAANQLEGKLANIHPDMGDESVKDMSTFKKLTGRDTMTADVKYETPITFENYATLMFAANEMPVFNEDNHAIWRRWLYIDFPYTFDETDPTAKDPEPKRELMDRLTTEEELEALLVRCQQEIQQWYGGREWYPDAMPPEDVRERMKRAAEPVYDFAMTCLNPVDDEDVWLPKEDVRTAYREYATENQLPKMGAEKFGQQLLNVADLQIESGRPRDGNGNRPHAYIGVSWTERGRQLMGLDEPDSSDDQTTVTDSQIDDSKHTLLEIVKTLVAENGNEAVSRDMVVGRAMTEMSMQTAER
ncbi:MAG: phage/plasmid primase, P4 family, partial [Natronomonas sp.]|uniref:phage/plasmid primase, P4 family n=1 Tax=Natronomonas sp. TaxID=2184060 RepID=UPI00287014E9